MATIGVAFVTLGCFANVFIGCAIIDDLKYSKDVDKFVVKYFNSLKFKRHIDIILDQQVKK